MNGFATSGDLESLFLRLAAMTEDERKDIPFALFVMNKGMLNGQEAFEYLTEQLNAQ